MPKLTTWFDHVDSFGTELATMRDATPARLPSCHIERMPAPPSFSDVMKISKKMRTQIFLSISGFDDDNIANYPIGRLGIEINVYSRDGHVADHGFKYERNELAALICEQLHVFLRDPSQYQLDEPTDREMQAGRSNGFTCRNLSFQGNPSPDDEGLAHWSIVTGLQLQSEPMADLTFEDLTRIDIALSGAELVEGGTPDSDDDESTRVTF